MKYRILTGNTVIGETDFEVRDPPMGVLSGSFVPAPAYESVRGIFRLYATAGINITDQDQIQLSEYYARRDALNLRLEAEDGTTLPVETIHIEDYSVEIDEYNVVVFTKDSEAYNRVARTTDPPLAPM